MKRKGFVISLFFWLFACLPVLGQQVTVGGPVSDLERITLTEDTPMDQALRVIQTFSNRAVVDPQHLTTPIGINIDRQPWRQALREIARHNGMEVVDRGNYLELLAVAPAKEPVRAEVPGATVDSREVSISAIFFQADRAALREFGVDWSTLSGGRVDVNASHLGADHVSSDQFSIAARANISRSISVDVLLKAFESKNVGEVVANPQVKVQSGKDGFVQVGSDFSVTTSDFAGNAITQFHSTGTMLTVTPTIFVEDGIDFVDLKVEAERSSLVDPVRNLISKTVAKTQTLLKDGEQTAIAGLFGHEVSRSRGGVPLLKDLPAWFFGLRYLFGYNSKQVSKTELILLLKADIVPSVRQRVEQGLAGRRSSEIIREKRMKFDEMVKDYEAEHSVPDTLKPAMPPE